MGAGTVSAYERVNRYVVQRANRRGLDPDLIHGLDTGCATEAELRLSDLQELLAQLRNAASMCSRPDGTCLAKSDVWDAERPKGKGHSR